MVDNYLPAFDMKKEKEIKNDGDIDEQISKIKDDIKARKEQKYPDMVEEIFLQDQQHKQRFQNMIKLEITENECIQCEICVKVCP